MAGQLNSERARRQQELDRATHAWQDRHGIYNPDWAEDHHPDRPGQPTAEQLAELERELRIINGQDPETGRYLEPPHDPSHLVARSNDEALLHLDLTPCPCGGRDEDVTSAVVEVTGRDEVGRRYTRTCRACGQVREVVYLIPAQPYRAPGPTGFAYGDPRRSQLIDAAQWWWVADQYARDLPPVGQVTREDWPRVRGRLTAAVAALDEVLSFVPAGESTLPPEAVWTPSGRAVREHFADRLDPGRVAAVRSAYLKVLAQLADRDEATGRSLGDPAAALATFRELESRLRPDERRWRELQGALRNWARRHSVDDRDWTEDGWAGDDRRRPTPEQAWELVREARRIAGGR